MKKLISDEMIEYIASYKYKIELHAHTYPCSGCSRISSEEMIHLLKKENYDAVVIANHFFYDHGEYLKSEDPIKTYMKDFYDAKAMGEKEGIKVLLGAEYRFLESDNDYLVFGVDEAFLRNTLNRSDLGIESFYKEFHNENRLIIQAHPFRNSGTAVDLDFLDGLEIMNMHPYQKSRTAVAAKYAAENHAPIVTVGTDLHHHEHVGISALRTKVLPEDEVHLVQILRSGDYIFEIGGYPMMPIPYLTV